MMNASELSFVGIDVSKDSLELAMDEKWVPQQNLWVVFGSGKSPSV